MGKTFGRWKSTGGMWVFLGVSKEGKTLNSGVHKFIDDKMIKGPFNKNSIATIKSK